MPMKILVLEDNEGRREAMKKRLVDRHNRYESVFFVALKPMLLYLRDHLGEASCISLDHDMELVADGEGRLSDPGTGREIADYLAAHPPQCPVVIHTTNTAAAAAMEASLKDSGWVALRVIPWGDLDWVRSNWLPTIRRAILDTAQRKHPVK